MDFDFRFGGVRRLYGQDNLDKFQNSHVMVVGLGGVGSWAAESMVRSGVGEISLVDMDEVCESNINRQVQALDGNVGKAKTSTLANRFQLINPKLKINEVFDFITADTINEILASKPDIVLDCIDSLKNKALLIAECRQRGIHVITTGGAGGKTDLFKLKKDDLAKTEADPLLAKLRKKLRKEYGFKTNGSRFHVDCVYSTEAQKYPTGDGCITTEKTEMNSTKLDCASGFGAITHITGAFGFALSSLALEHLSKN